MSKPLVIVLTVGPLLTGPGFSIFLVRDCRAFGIARWSFTFGSGYGSVEGFTLSIVQNSSMMLEAPGSAVYAGGSVLWD